MRLSICISRKQRGNGSRKTERRKTFRRGTADGTSFGCAPAAFRFHYNVSLYFPAAHDGAGAPDRLPEDQGAANRRRALQSRSTILARIFGINFALGVVTGIPMEFQFGTNWGSVFEGGGRSDWSDAGRWKVCSPFFSNRAPWDYFIW